jgi:type I restriction enzyme S subunit
MTYFGNSRLGDLFVSRRAKGREGLQTLSVTLNDGLIDREDLNRKQETTLSPEQHLLVKPGDIAYNMMRMWQGAFGLAKTEGMVSPAYVVLRPTEKIDPSFAVHLFNQPRMAYLFWAYSYGMTEDRLRLYFEDFKKIPAYVPSKSEQIQITSILKVWDQAIELTIRLINCNRQQKKYLTTNLLGRKSKTSQVTRTGGFHRLDEVCSIHKGNSLAKGDIEKGGVNQCIVYGELFTTYEEVIEAVESRTNSNLGFESKSGDVLMPTATTTVAMDLAKASALLVDNVLIGGDAIVLRPDKSKVLPEFLAYTLTHSHRREISARAQGSTIVHLSKGDIEDLDIFLPPIDAQLEIVKILRCADSLLTRELKKLKEMQAEYVALSRLLLNGSAMKSKIATT